MAGGRRVPPVSVNHAAIDHAQLKQWTDDADPSKSQSFADDWTGVGAIMTDAAESLKRAAMGTEAGWTGEAADAMRVRLGQIAAWSGGTGAQISAASQSIAQQSEAADAARRAMPEPVSYNPGDIIRDAPGNGLLALVALPDLIYQRYEQSNAAHEEAVRVVSERDNTMNDAAGRVALFQAPPRLDGSDHRDDDGDDDRTHDGSDGDPKDGDPGPGGESAPRRAAPGAGHVPTGGSEPGGSAPGGVSPAASSGDPGTTTPESFAPREPVAAGSGNVAPHAAPPGPGFVPGFGPVGGGGLGGSGELGGSGGGSRGVGAGAGPRGGGGALGAGPGAGKAVPGSATAAEAAAARGAGRGGPTGGMPVGGGRRDEDDAEHQRPEFLQEPDPEGIFDSDVLTAPSVIGGPDDE